MKFGGARRPSTDSGRFHPRIRNGLPDLLQHILAMHGGIAFLAIQYQHPASAGRESQVRSHDWGMAGDAQRALSSFRHEYNCNQPTRTGEGTTLRDPRDQLSFDDGSAVYVNGLEDRESGKSEIERNRGISSLLHDRSPTTPLDLRSLGLRARGFEKPHCEGCSVGPSHSGMDIRGPCRNPSPSGVWCAPTDSVATAFARSVTMRKRNGDRVLVGSTIGPPRRRKCAQSRSNPRF